MKSTNVFKELFIVILVIFALVFTLNEYMYGVTPVTGISMMPTIHDDDVMLLNRYKELERFDIVVFDQDADTKLIKRIIGMPGDHIMYEDDQLYINGKAYDEPYLSDAKNELLSGTLTEDFTLEGYTGYEVIPKDHYFVLGDNRRNSTDSRVIGLIPAEKMLGKTNFILNPQQRIGFIK